VRIFLVIAFALGLGACAGVAQRPPPRPAAPAPVLQRYPAGADSPEGGAAVRETIVALATSMLGQPYRYGGAAPGGFDCSGLVAYAAGGAGVRVPRTARQQYADSVPVRGRPRQGDLVFMHLAGKELHVGIAVDARSFIHAPAAGGRVRIDSLSAAPYAHGFMGARRIVPTP